MRKILFFAGLIFSFSTLFGQAPEGYYVEAIGKSGQALKEAIRDIAKRGVKKHSYNWDVDQTDQIPEKLGKVKLIYTLKEENVGNHKASGKSGYNREHIWPKSLMVPSQSEMWDNQNLRASEPYENSKRGNKRYGSYMPPSVSRGDCARICFFMSLVYDWNIDIVGDQDMLILWSDSDPVDNFEIRRNNELQKAQGNRNPFLDYPELIEYLWGSKYGQQWNPDNGGGGNPNPPVGATLLSEDFNTFPGPWEIKSVKGSNVWKQSKFNNETFAKISGYKKQDIDPETECWLISKDIALPGKGKGVFSFENKNGYFRGVTLEVYISEDYNGDENSANWVKLEAKIDDQEHKKEDGSLTYNPEWVKSGDIDLSQYAGKTINIGFKYIGTKDVNTTYEIDNINISVELPLFIQEVNNNKSSGAIYPNPSHMEISIKNREVNSTVDIFNLTGQKIYTSTENRISVASLKYGMYFVQYTDVNGIKKTEKFLKK